MSGKKLMQRVQPDDITQLEIVSRYFARLSSLSGVKYFHTIPPLFVENKLVKATERLKNGKAVGRDNIPPRIAKATAHLTQVHSRLRCFETYLFRIARRTSAVLVDCGKE